MNRDRDIDVEALQALVAGAHERSACPSAELLARAAAGDADAGERGRVADHIATCASCSEEYRTAAALAPWVDAVSGDAVFAGGSGRTAPRWRSETLAYAAAAVLAVAGAIVLANWALTLRGENERLTAALRERATDARPAATADDPHAGTIADLQARLADATVPSLNAPIVDLLPPDVVRGSARTLTPRVSAAAKSVTFVMTTAADPASREHEIEVVDGTGAVHWRGSGLRPNAERAFTITMPTALLPPGTCHIRLYDPRSGGRRLVADYSVVVDR